MIIPAIDLIDGQTVRLYQGSYDQTTHYSQTPFELRDRYAAAGAGVLHLVDLSGAKDASKRQTTLLRELMQQSPLLVQVGEDEHLLSQSLCLRDSAGLDLRLELYPGQWHVFQINCGLLAVAALALRRVAEFLGERGCR